MTLTIGSLFAGIGGLELGLERAGFGPVRWQVEIDPFCRGVLARHWPEARRYDDVRTIGRDVEPVGLLCGGFPCQDVSMAGRGAGLDGERSGLWREFARVVRVLLPRVVVVENVSALLGRGLDRVLGDLSACGYDASWSTVRASDVGAPHQRDRLFVVAVGVGLADADERRREGLRVEKPCGEQGARGREPHGRGVLRRVDDAARDVAAERDALRLVAERDQRQGGRARASERGDAEPGDDREEGGRRAESGVGGVPDGLSDRVDRWPAGPGEEQAGWEPPRALPKGRHPMRRERLKALGNAVVPQVGELVGREVWRVLDGLPNRRALGER